MLSVQTLLRVAFVCTSTRLGTADINVIPQDFVVRYDQSGQPANNLTVICSAPAETDLHSIYFMQLRKQGRSQNTKTKVATLMQNTGDGHLVREVGLDNRAYVISWLLTTENPASSFLRVEFNDASCTDEGQFECKVDFYRHGSQQSETMFFTASVTTFVPPDQVFLVQRPSYDSFLINQTLQIHCSGQVGYPPTYYRWQYRHTGLGAEDASEYEGLTFGVTHSEGPFPQGFCKYYRSATLWLRATQELDGVQIRCLLVRGVKQYENVSASFTLRVKDGGCIPECLNGGTCESHTCLCLPAFSGSSCELPLDKPCTENCGDTSSRAAVHDGSTSKSILLLLLLVTRLLI